ncbi:acyl-coenzyme A oxidase-like protein isoform X2 [Balaenoptera ricei]|uniref:acyl-coenzyme A oxidase-like protein isoform X2 n=1 Tax=Balaenoptera ricei TaxID=2746895 RepID=UPI0028BE4677|nr:acyl-coenzyme A oxidase-like protein isoform X2 [Balaenoptera ricei]
MRALTFQRVTFTMGLPLLKRTIQDQAEKTKNFVSRSLVIGEVVSIADVATGVKCGIIYWLFGGAIRNLGSPARVTKWLQPLQEQKYTGMFAMTERGHRSNVRGIQTEATFDLSAQEFVIDTPCENAEKMYIGNATYGNYAAVFAQLIINGRSQGLHGVDNGILRFDKVRIPRENLLDKFGSVAPDGQYHSPIKDKSARFNAILAVLTPSRLAVTFQATGSVKGYMMENRISGLKCDTDVFVTFEDDSGVVLQVVVQELLAQYTKQYEERPISSLPRNWTESGGDKLRTSFLAFNMDTVGNLAFLLKAVNFRERVLQRGLVARIYYKVTTEKEDFFSAWSSCLHHVTCLSLAHIHRVTLERFSLAVRRCPEKRTRLC